MDGKSTDEEGGENGPLRWELKLQLNIQEVSQHNIIVLGGHSKDAGKSIKCLIAVRS